MKIIFLDIDGVLNSKAYDRMRDVERQGNIDETRLEVLKRIVDATGARIVLSSTWRLHWSKDESRCDGAGQEINRVFAKYGLEIYDRTPFFGIHVSRQEEIKAWLNAAVETVESFVIIDDYPFGWEELSDRMVKTDPNFRLGLEADHAEKAIRILLS